MSDFGNIQNYEDALSFIYSFKANKSHLSQAEILNYVLAEKLAIKEEVQSLNVIQITGTDGKGSVCHYLEHFFLQSQLDVIVFTSPHINSIRERIRINGDLITKEKVVEIIAELVPLLEELRMTPYHVGPFQIMFIVCLIIHCRFFKNHWGVYEVATGGYNDETNVFATNIVGITTITGDHQELYGGFSALVHEKIKLCKPGCVILSQNQYPLTNKLFKEFTSENNIQLYYSGQQIPTEASVYLIPGPAQKANYAMAAKIMRIIGASMNRSFDTTLKEPIVLMGRYQSFAVAGKQLTIDTAHTVNSVSLLLRCIANKAGKKTLIFANSEKRDSDKLLFKILNSKVFQEVCFTEILSYGGRPAAALKNKAESIGFKNIYATDTLFSALKLSINILTPNDVYIFGSFRLARDLDPSIMAMGFPPVLSKKDDIDQPREWFRNIQ